MYEFLASLILATCPAYLKRPIYYYFNNAKFLIVQVIVFLIANFIFVMSKYFPDDFASKRL
jgi:hypothetical protein